MSDDFVVHASPVNRERADFIINADIAEPDKPRRYEQLWVRQLGEARFELCCIPFFLYDVALGDEVETAPRDGRRYILARVLRPSGRFVFRAWFGSSTVAGAREELIGELTKAGRIFEWYSDNLLAIDAPDDAAAQALADLLAAREETGALVYETGRS